MSLTDQVNENRTSFTSLLNVVYTAVEPDRIEAEMLVRDDMLTTWNMAHGGSLMSFADTMGAVAAFHNLPEGAATTTLESKTNFLRPAPLGDTLRGVCTPVHKGRTTMVWRTEIFREDGKLVAVVTQTQMVMPARSDN